MKKVNWTGVLVSLASILTGAAALLTNYAANRQEEEARAESEQRIIDGVVRRLRGNEEEED